MEYKAIYKCRLCGAVYHNGQTADESVAAGSLEEMTLDMCGQYPDAPLKTNMHRCGGDHAGSLGLADFQGWAQVMPDDPFYKLTDEGQQLYDKTVFRLKRMGVTAQNAQIVALAREIEYYRERIHGFMEREARS